MNGNHDLDTTIIRDAGMTEQGSRCLDSKFNHASDTTIIVDAKFFPLEVIGVP